MKQKIPKGLRRFDMDTPKMLRWLASTAGFTLERVEQLWQSASAYAARITKENESRCHLSHAHERMVTLVEQEILATNPVEEAPWLMILAHLSVAPMIIANNFARNFARVGEHGARAIDNGQPVAIGLIQDFSEIKHADAEIQHYVEQLKFAFMSPVKVAATLRELCGPYTTGHQRRVAEIAVAIGAGLGLDKSRQEGLRFSGYLHDIGKNTIPAEILSKPGKLSAIEYRLIQGHPQAGYEALKDIECLWPLAQVELQHHEHIDGSGYPQGLKGEEILLEARIMAVADVIDEMSSQRPYRRGFGIEAALGELALGSGSKYDPVVANNCLQLFQGKGYMLPA